MVSVVESPVKNGHTRSNPNPADGEESVIKAYSVQCSSCMKWRLIPSRELYEEIRQGCSANPFVCIRAQAWKSTASCGDPSDVSQNGDMFWVIDQPDIPVAPPGWERLLVFRTISSSGFADVYYKSPAGKRLRTIREIERYLKQNPKYRKGVKLSQFSFKKPKPLDPHYFKKTTPTDVVIQGCITPRKRRSH